MSNATVSWRPYRKVNDERLARVVTHLKAESQIEVSTNLAVQILRADNLDDATRLVRKDPTSKLNGETPQTATDAINVVAAVVQIYKDFSEGEPEKSEVISLAFTVTDRELEELKEEMKRWGIEDLQLFIRSALQLQSKIGLLLKTRDDIVRVKANGKEISLQVFPSK